MTIFGGLTHLYNCEADLQNDLIGNVDFDLVIGGGTAPVSVDNPAINKINQHLEFSENACLSTTPPNPFILIPETTPNTSFTIAMWVRYPTATPPQRSDLFVQNGGAAGLTFGTIAVYLQQTNNQFRFRLEEDGGGTVTVVASGVTVVPDTWYFVVAWASAETSSCGLVVNGVEHYVANTYSGGINDSGGTQSFLGGGSTFATTAEAALIDEVAIWNRALPCHEREALYDSGAGRNLLWWYGIQNYWPMESDTPDQEIDQLDPLGFETRWDRIGTPPSVAGLQRQAVDFAVVGDYMRMLFKGNDLIPGQDQATGPFTVSFWVKFDDVTGEQVFLLGGNGTSQPSGLIWMFRKLAGGDVEFVHIEPALAARILTLSGLGLVASTWYHMTVTSEDNGTMTLNVDGTSTTTAFGANEFDTVANAAVYMAHGPGDTVELDGQMDEVAIWDQHFPDARIAELYNSGAGVNLFEGWPDAVAPTSGPLSGSGPFDATIFFDLEPVVTVGDCDIAWHLTDFDPVAPGVQSSVVIPGEGTWTKTGSVGTLTFVPEPGFIGSSEIDYTVSDFDGDLSGVSTITATVNAPPSGGVGARAIYLRRRRRS